jgi:S-adenosylmethionine-diacylglycerol 3-amino-3-carboxypropyl transferase
MQALINRMRRWEFESRIFVSLMIVLTVCLLSSTLFDASPANSVLAGRGLGFSTVSSLRAGFLIAAALLTLASLLRMWAGSVLTSNRVMAFKVQHDTLLIRGPYHIVRNPIYLADLIAMGAFALCLPPSGVFLPLLLYAHYVQLVKYEELSLAAQFGDQYTAYTARVPRIIPDPGSLRNISEALMEFHISFDGFRHNALYVFFIAGCIVAVFTLQFIYVAIIGLPAVYDWAVLHTRKGLARRVGNERPRLWKQESKPNRQSLWQKNVFEDILYAQCWEDPASDRAALHIGPEDVVFTITSGGCNALAFLLDNPHSVIALDMSPYQNYLLELKIAAFRMLDHDELLEFVGVRASDRRRQLYRRLRDVLGEAGRSYWDSQAEKLDAGIIHCGRYERYMRLLRVWLYRLIGETTIRQFYEAASAQERAVLFHQKWENIWWRLFTRVLLSRTTMTLLFDKAFFKYLDSSFSLGRNFARHTKHALTELPMRENYFLSYILLGRYYSEEYLPPYLMKKNFDIIKSRVDRIEIVTDNCEHYFRTRPNGSIDKFNFSNIFEWMSPEAYELLLRDTVRVASDDALLSYRNLLVSRERPETLAHWIRTERALAQVLLQQDLSFIYNNYVVELIDKGGGTCNIQLLQSAAAAR